MVENVHPDTSEQELQRQFSLYGNVEQVSKSGEIAHITFRYVGDATNARHNMHKNVFQGRELRVDFSKVISSPISIFHYYL